MSNIRGITLATSKLDSSNTDQPVKRYTSTVILSSSSTTSTNTTLNNHHHHNHQLGTCNFNHSTHSDSSHTSSQINRDRCAGLHEARLVTVNERSQDSSSEDEESQQDRCKSSPQPVIDSYEDEDDNVNSYFEDYGSGYGRTRAIDELTDLSRESMMPLHELIAYFQCINDNHNLSVSRQSSRASSRGTAKLNSSSLTLDSIDGPLKGSEQDKKHDVIPGALEEVALDEDYDTLKPPPVRVVITRQLSSASASSSTSSVTKQSHNSTPKEADFTPLPPPLSDSNIEEPILDQKADNKSESLPPPSLPPVKDRRKVRANVIRELINSERDFVKHLKDVVEGYLLPARRHPEIFTVLRIKTIFANIEQLYEFQQKFLAHLETCIKWDDLASSEVGHCFLEHEHEFSVYHYYCNNHPNASSELLDLLNKPRFVKFFEACSVTLKEQNMINQAIDSLLLTPVQKICRYSLQLNELLKNTDEDHPDFCPVVDALESMRNCANLANERRRRIEALANVMSFQEKFENWFGPKLCDTSSILIHSGEVVKESSHSWPTSVQLYLFDHLLLYCKKDLLKRNSLILKGRIAMESVKEITDADEYKPKKSFKLFCDEQKKWFVFTAGSEREKDEWMTAFERERNLVEADENEGFHITEKEIGVAKLELQKRKNPAHHRSTRLRHKRPDTAVVDLLDMNDVTTIMNRTLSLPSCIHPNHVMNFVEDSRVVSKKKTPENRSPMSSSTALADQENSQQQPSPQSTGWFRKMGSKKLAKSQVYTVNGSASSSSSSSKNRSASPNFLSEASVTKYNQLEKRHRDHMVGEEQARLLRLNNYTLPTNYAMKSQQTKQLPHQQMPDLNCSNVKSTSHLPDGFSQARNEATINFEDRGIALNGSEKLSSNERTVMLPTGRIVRVREDEV